MGLLNVGYRHPAIPRRAKTSAVVVPCHMHKIVVHSDADELATEVTHAAAARNAGRRRGADFERCADGLAAISRDRRPDLEMLRYIRVLPNVVPSPRIAAARPAPAGAGRR